MANMSTFASRLKKLRTAAGMSQAELATVLKLSPSYVGMCEQGRRVPSTDVLADIADVFNVDVDYLLGRSDQTTVLDPSRLTPAMIVKDGEAYYLDDEAREIANRIFHDDDLRLLFDAARDASPEDLQVAHEMLKVLKKRERGDDY
jgi:transcriptional regulator with XRE-family HTH domain